MPSFIDVATNKDVHTQDILMDWWNDAIGFGLTKDSNGCFSACKNATKKKTCDGGLYWNGKDFTWVK